MNFPTQIYNTEVATFLPVMEEFYTLQGEGYHQGRAAYFIRLAGCDVGCVWCDVKESWESNESQLKPVEAIALSASQFAGNLAVVTGGEPAMHDLSVLTARLRELGFQLNIETSGAYPLTGEWDWICLSPKKFKPPLPENLLKANELKVIIHNNSDFDWAEKFESLVRPDCKLFLQPEWSRSGKVTLQITDYIMNHPQWAFSLQLHKYINLP